MKFTLRRIANRKRWLLDYRTNGKQHRLVFKTKELAEAEQERIEKQITDGGTAWLAISPAERIEVMTIHREVQEAGYTLRKVWEDHKRGFHGGDVKRKTLQAAYNQFIAEREQMLSSDSTMAALRSNVGRFIRPRAELQVTAVARQDVMDWLVAFKGRTFNSYLTSLNTFFRWSVKLKYLKASPAADIEKIDERRMANLDEEPPVMSPAQVVALLQTARRTDPALLPYIAVCLLAGLRPEREAGHLAWSDIGETILVRGLHAKDRQRRYVTILPVLAAWLARPFYTRRRGPVAGNLPPRNLRRRFEAVRAAAGLFSPKSSAEDEGKWKHDWMRHTFASYHLALYGAEKTIAALGHGDYEMLFGHYRALVTREQAEQFWKLTPDGIRQFKPHPH